MAEKQIHKPEMSWLTADKVARLSAHAKALEMRSRTPAPGPASADRLKPQPKSTSHTPQRPAPDQILPKAAAAIPPAPMARAQPLNIRGERWLQKLRAFKIPSFDLPRWLKLPAPIKPLWATAAIGVLAVAAGVTMLMRNSAPVDELPEGMKYSQPGDAPETGTSPPYISPSKRANAPVTSDIERAPHQIFQPGQKPAPRAPIEIELDSPALSGMTSPLAGYELTDYKPSRGFGRLFHPIRKKMKHHDGVDFKAPAGTPVYAISDGVIEGRGWEGGYGNTIRIAHAQETNSLYAHLSRFAKGIKPGTKIKQGDLIGYVGSTGLSTGPHLHFEIHKNDKPVDPLKEAIAHSQARAQISDIDTLMAMASQREKLNPQVLPNIFAKEARNLKTGKLDTTALSDSGHAGLCQFGEQTFLTKLKQHGPRLGFAKYADQIKYSVGQDGRTYYKAKQEAQEGKLLDLRFKPAVAIPVCAAHIKDDLTSLQAHIKRPLTIADSATSHFTGWSVAKNIIAAYDNPSLRNTPAYQHARKENYAGSDTNMRVFFKGGDQTKPYTVAEFYENKVRIVGNAPALAKDIKLAQNTPQ